MSAFKDKPDHDFDPLDPEARKALMGALESIQTLLDEDDSVVPDDISPDEPVLSLDNIPVLEEIVDTAPTELANNAVSHQGATPPKSKTGSHFGSNPFEVHSQAFEQPNLGTASLQETAATMPVQPNHSAFKMKESVAPTSVQPNINLTQNQAPQAPSVSASPAAATPAPTNSATEALSKQILSNLDERVSMQAELILQEVLDEFVPQIEAELHRRLKISMNDMLENQVRAFMQKSR